MPIAYFIFDRYDLDVLLCQADEKAKKPYQESKKYLDIKNDPNSKVKIVNYNWVFECLETGDFEDISAFLLDWCPVHNI